MRVLYAHPNSTLIEIERSLRLRAGMNPHANSFAFVGDGSLLELQMTLTAMEEDGLIRQKERLLMSIGFVQRTEATWRLAFDGWVEVMKHRKMREQREAWTTNST